MCPALVELVCEALAGNGREPGRCWTLIMYAIVHQCMYAPVHDFVPLYFKEALGRQSSTQCCNVACMLWGNTGEARILLQVAGRALARARASAAWPLVGG